MKTSPKLLYSVIENARFGLVFAKTVSIISGTVGRKVGIEALEFSRAGIFKQSMGAMNRVGKGYGTGPPGYLDWRN